MIWIENKDTAIKWSKYDIKKDKRKRKIMEKKIQKDYNRKNTATTSIPMPNTVGCRYPCGDSQSFVCFYAIKIV